MQKVKHFAASAACWFSRCTIFPVRLHFRPKPRKDGQRSTLNKRNSSSRSHEPNPTSLTKRCGASSLRPKAQLGEAYSGFEPRSLPQQQNFSESRELRPFEQELAGKQYRDAFHTYLIGGEKMLNSGARNLLADTSAEVRTYTGLNTTTSGDAGGYVIPIGFQRELEVRLKAVGRMRANCRMLTTATGNTLDWPTMDDTDNTGEFLAESNPVTQLNPTFNQVQFQSLPGIVQASAADRATVPGLAPSMWNQFSLRLSESASAEP